MKFSAIILSVFFLALGMIPCADGLVGQENGEFVQMDSSDEHSHNESDDCSPFCQCHCCHVHVVTVASTSFEVIDLPISTLIIQNGHHIGFDLPDYHFQPPRI